LDGSGDGVIAVSPCRYSGIDPADGSVSASNMGRNLTTTGEIAPAAEELVNGDIVVSGPAFGTATLYFHRVG
jgi:hypothetical protein